MRNKSGFTLIELLIAIALMMIIVLMIQQMFTRANALYRIAAERTDVFSQGRLALDAIETDIQRINPVYGDLILASHEPEDYFSVADVKKVPQHFDFTRLPQNEKTGDIIPVLAFFTTTSWQSPKEQKFESGPAQVIYYLRKRPNRNIANIGEFELLGGYLMRRIVPYRTMDVRGNRDRSLELPPEEEIASSVISARVYATNNAAPAYMLQSNRSADVMALLPTDNPTGAASLLLDKQDFGQNAAGGPPTSLLFARPTRDRTYSFGSEAGQMQGNLTTRQYLPMSIAVELTFVNDQFDMDETGVRGTVRTISRVISVPNSQPAVFLTPDDIVKFP